MHYMNGREAKSGDKVINVSSGETGLLHSVSASSTTCNGRIAKINPNDSYVTISECLHMDDASAVLTTNVPDTSAPVADEPAPVDDTQQEAATDASAAHDE